LYAKDNMQNEERLSRRANLTGGSETAASRRIRRARHWWDIGTPLNQTADRFAINYPSFFIISVDNYDKMVFNIALEHME
jgi:hypothetical protein